MVKRGVVGSLTRGSHKMELIGIVLKDKSALSLVITRVSGNHADITNAHFNKTRFDEIDN